MPTLESDRRTRITYPDTVDVAIHPGQTVPGTRAAIVLPTPTGNLLADDLAQANVDLIDAISIGGQAGAQGMRAAPGEAVVIEAPLDMNQDAVVLLESDDVYTWRLPDPPPGGGRSALTATFTLSGPGSDTGTRGTSGETRNAVT